jgi:hypothetical protein
MSKVALQLLIGRSPSRHDGVAPAPVRFRIRPKLYTASAKVNIQPTRRSFVPAEGAPQVAP